MNRKLAGMVSGLVATVPMTLVMSLMQRFMEHSENGPLPPHEVTTELAKKTGMAHHANRPEHSFATGMAHFSFGAAAGAEYPAFEDRLPVRVAPAVKGAVYGLVVFATSYQKALPRLGILPPASERPLRRNLLLIASHLVWGVTLGVLTERLTE